MTLSYSEKAQLVIDMLKEQGDHYVSKDGVVDWKGVACEVMATLLLADEGVL